MRWGRSEVRRGEDEARGLHVERRMIVFWCTVINSVSAYIPFRTSVWSFETGRVDSKKRKLDLSVFY